MNGMKVARYLGWASLGLGLAEILAPRRIARALGTSERPGLVRTAYGLREIASGAGILLAPNPGPWVWSRVAGDLVDLGTLGSSLRDNPRRRNAVLATVAVLGLTAIDLACASRLTSRR